jgi:large subunit ribosomal protein L4
MKVKLINQKGKELEEQLSLDKMVWDLPFNEDLVAQVLYVHNSNKRRGTANAKKRSEVSGGGRKPWRQKGTGRARAGSTRSPLWVKGGVTFVPNDRNWSKKINLKMKKKAIGCVLSSKLRDNSLKIVKFSDKAEAKILREDFLKLFDNSKTLIVSDNEKILNALRNVESFLIAKPQTLNVYNVLNNKNIVLDSNSVQIIEGRLKNEK